MDKNKLSEILLMDDSIVSMQDLVVMQRLSAKYPYCNVFRMLEAKFAFIVNSYNKTELLQTASVYVSDREYLKTVISSINTKPKQFRPINAEKKKEDIITKINSYEDEQLSDNPTRQELLDRFLKVENPKPQTEDKTESQQDGVIDRAIKQSASKDFKIVTETMAKIFAKQGDKTKAIQIYKQLIAQNPNKEMYYTNQIEILKNN